MGRAKLIGIFALCISVGFALVLLLWLITQLASLFASNPAPARFGPAPVAQVSPPISGPKIENPLKTLRTFPDPTTSRSEQRQRTEEQRSTESDLSNSTPPDTPLPNAEKRETNETSMPPVAQVSPAVTSPTSTPLKVFSGERYAETRYHEFTGAELEKWSVDHLQYAINEIFARHGAVFPNKKNQDYYEQFWWYKPKPGFTLDQIEAALPDVERHNVRIMGEARNAKLISQNAAAAFSGAWTGAVRPIASASGRQQTFIARLEIGEASNSARMWLDRDPRSIALAVLDRNGNQLQLRGRLPAPISPATQTVTMTIISPGRVEATFRTDADNGGWAVFQGTLSKQ